MGLSKTENHLHPYCVQFWVKPKLSVPMQNPQTERIYFDLWRGNC